MCPNIYQLLSSYVITWLCIVLGYFMFASAAKDKEEDEEAVMASPVISGMPNFCFKFYFDMKVITYIFFSKNIWCKAWKILSSGKN